MEVETVWTQISDSFVASDEEDMREVYAEEVILEEDGSPATPLWNFRDVLNLRPVESGGSTSGEQHGGSTPPSIPASLTPEEDSLLEESFELMEDLECGNYQLDFSKSGGDSDNVVEKAQALLDDLDDYIKKEPFSDWLEEKAELPLMEDLDHYDNYRSGPTTVLHYHPRGPNAPATQVGPAPPDLGAYPHLPQVGQTSLPEEAPLTPALMKEFETVLNQTLTPPHSPPTYLDLVDTQEEDNRRNKLGDAELEALINSQVASFYDVKQPEKSEWTPEASLSPSSNWGSSTQVATEDSDSACHSSSYDSDPDWGPDRTKATGRSRRSVSSVEERKLRKKEQNKNAATRYRLKKKAEQAGIMGEESVLVEKNNQLKEKATELQREIKYLKSLMRDICKAQGLLK